MAAKVESFRESGEQLVEQVRKVARMLYRLIVTRKERFNG